MRLGLFPRLSPHIHAMPLDKNRLGVWIIQHGLFHRVFELMLEWRIVNDGDNQGIPVTQALNALDHFQMRHSKLLLALLFQHRSQHHGRYRMRMQARARIPQIKGQEEQRLACRHFQLEVDRIFQDLFGFRIQHENILLPHALFLNSTGSQVNPSVFANGQTATSSCAPAQRIKQSAQSGDDGFRLGVVALLVGHLLMHDTIFVMIIMLWFLELIQGFIFGDFHEFGDHNTAGFVQFVLHLVSYAGISLGESSKGSLVLDGSCLVLGTIFSRVLSSSANLNWIPRNNAAMS
mmetsp:Transcript_1746/g.2998  ORF Transcript_1746/g.2998 Transcript_1746/m.2998 type:complete len:291 (-) Transcript_1746:583-1455(-)